MPVKEISDFGKSESRIARAKKDYQIALRKYQLAYDKVLNKSTLPGISLIKEENKKIIENALQFWEEKRLTSHAWCIMSNHFHWVLTVFDKEVEIRQVLDSPESERIPDLGKSESLKKPVYIQDILHSVKLFSARQINKNENRTGQLWGHESFETTVVLSTYCRIVIPNFLPVQSGGVSESAIYQ